MNINHFRMRNEDGNNNDSDNISNLNFKKS